MKNIANFLISLIVTAWIGAIAILSLQNATLVSLKFLTFESIQLPVGIVLAFSVGVGVMGGAIVPIFWQLAGQSRETYQDEEY
ncbi:MAG TPA: DUF1049 domain-containing protein [Cyanobacteria bacterium UBA8803]|nr:DUF1049 domain-containing protein [Cyanobacteria bacterium UBA9273]HBL59388.1 DUF1049 domain-containing protein [Cyanobacteria bacterium UBA8803]